MIHMHTTICFDFGNTRLKYAVFENGKLSIAKILEDENPSSLKKIIDEYKPHKTLLSSVINHSPETENILTENSAFHLLNHTSKLPFTTPVGKPETVGADRLALVAAAVHLYPNQHNLIIGSGSCITYNFVNKFYEFLGGSISPGMEMRFKAMHNFTAKLPLIKADENFPLIGYDTRTNLISGVVNGICAEIDGIINLYKEKFNNFNVLLTGGDLGFFVPQLKNKIFADPNLIFKGLYAISETNE